MGRRASKRTQPTQKSVLTSHDVAAGPIRQKNMKFYINIVVIRILVLLAGHSTPQTQSSTLGSAMNRWRPRCHTGRTDIGIHTPNQRIRKISTKCIKPRCHLHTVIRTRNKEEEKLSFRCKTFFFSFSV